MSAIAGPIEANARARAASSIQLAKAYVNIFREHGASAVIDGDHALCLARDAHERAIACEEAANRWNTIETP